MDKNKIRHFRKTLRKLERLSETQQKNCCSGATLAQCHVLLEVEEFDQVTTGQLADSLGLDKSTLSRTIDGLVNLGLLERLSNPHDRRTIPLSLTTQGKTVCNAINEASDTFYTQAFEKIPTELQQNVLESFDRLVSALLEIDRNSKSNKVCQSTISINEEEMKND